MSGNGWLFRIQPGAEGDSLRLLGAHEAEMAGSHAGRCHSQDQQGYRGIPVLQQAVLSREKVRHFEQQTSVRIPPELHFTGSGGVFLLGKYAEAGKRQ